VEQDLIAREQGVEDRRQVYIKLTERGAEILEQLAEAHRREIRRIGPSLGPLLERLMLDENADNFSKKRFRYEAGFWVIGSDR
jgi:DNA-binding MarR family transcriptional regulator